MASEILERSSDLVDFVSLLPDEIVLLIYTFLPTPDIFHSVALVSSQWHHAMTLPGFWMSLCEAKLVARRRNAFPDLLIDPQWLRSEMVRELDEQKMILQSEMRHSSTPKSRFHRGLKTFFGSLFGRFLPSSAADASDTIEPSPSFSDVALSEDEIRARLSSAPLEDIYRLVFIRLHGGVFRFTKEYCSAEFHDEHAAALVVSSDGLTCHRTDDSKGGFPSISLSPPILRDGSVHRISIRYLMKPPRTNRWMHFGFWSLPDLDGGITDPMDERLRFSGQKTSWIGSPSNSWSFGIHGFSFWPSGGGGTMHAGTPREGGLEGTGQHGDVVTMEIDLRGEGDPLQHAVRWYVNGELRCTFQSTEGAIRAPIVAGISFPGYDGQIAELVPASQFELLRAEILSKKKTQAVSSEEGSELCE